MIDKYNAFKVLKIISIENHSNIVAIVLTQIQRIKQYLIRLHEVQWEGGLIDIF